MTTPLCNTDTFIKRYVALTDGEMAGRTDEDNPQPILISGALAIEAPTCRVEADDIPASFFDELNTKLIQSGASVIAFPTTMFEACDICIMDAQLFLGITQKTVKDDEANLSIEGAHTSAIDQVKHLLSTVEPAYAK
tara:strand:- start:13419 stop:13829 length:411 start_codon:yes stop_codon:yes gene_type:complete